MQFRKYIYWIAQLTGWLVYGMLIILSAYNDNPAHIQPVLILEMLILITLNIIYTHLMSRACIHLGWLEFRLARLLPRILFISLLCSILITFSSLFIDFLFDSSVEKHSTLSIIINILATSLLVILWNAIYFTYHYFQKSKVQELNNISLESSKNEIELKNLRSQLNPHFLFNSLNSIRALIDIEPAKAKTSITTLSNLLRSSLLAGKVNLVPLESEIELVSNYLELEKVRFEERLTVSWQLDDSLNSFAIPPFCLQMLVENAIKHGVSNRMEGGLVEIITKKMGNDVCLAVRNSGKLGNSVDTGIGIQNTIRRLAIQFSGNAQFDINEDGDSVLATVIFKN